MNSTSIDTRKLKARLQAAQAALQRHKQSGFHERHPCGGCHWWQGYIAAIDDTMRGHWHEAMYSNTQAQP